MSEKKISTVTLLNHELDSYGLGDMEFVLVETDEVVKNNETLGSKVLSKTGGLIWTAVNSDIGRNVLINGVLYATGGHLLTRWLNVSGLKTAVELINIIRRLR